MVEFIVSVFKYCDGKLYMVKNKIFLDVCWSCLLLFVLFIVIIFKDVVGWYFVLCFCEFEFVLLLIIFLMVGIDVGLKDLFVIDIGFRFGNFCYIVKYVVCLVLF